MNAKEERAPSWVDAPFHRFQDYVEAASYLHLGVGMIFELFGVEEVRRLTQFERGRQIQEGSFLDHTLEVIVGEQAGKTSYLASNLVVALWGALEVLVEDLIFVLLLNASRARQSDAVKALRISIGEYEALDQEGRMRYITQKVMEAAKAPLKDGVGQFEDALSLIGLGGPVDRDIRRDLLELQQLRHVVVHRAGVADRMFVERRPWVGATVGDLIVLQDTRSYELVGAALAYVSGLRDRVLSWLAEPQLPPETQT